MKFDLRSLMKGYKEGEREWVWEFKGTTIDLGLGHQLEKM